MVDKIGNIKVKNLLSAISHSRRRLQPFRQNRIRALSEYVGKNYSDSGSQNKVPVNLIELAVNTYTRQLASRRPIINVTTNRKEYKIFAKEFELALNHLMKALDFEHTLRAATVDALFSMGIVKTGVCEPEHSIRGFLLRAGQPYAETVSLDDWVHDMTARNFNECSYMGNRFRLPLHAVKGSDLYINTEDIKPVRRQRFNEHGDTKAQGIGSDESNIQDEAYEYCELWEMWLPQEQKVVTFAADDTGAPQKLIRVVDWDGPTFGPYHILSYEHVPGNTMPLPPVASLIDMHQLTNNVFRKLARQAERQKDIVGYRGSSEQDAENVRDAADGEMVRIDDPDSVKTFKFGGIDQQALGFMIQTKNLFTYLGGNLDALGGLGSMSDTVGQDRMMIQSASQRMADMQDATIDFTRRVCSAIGEHLFADKFVKLELEKAVGPSGKVKVPFVYEGRKAEGEFMDFNLQIQPHSMQQTTPGMRLQALTQVMGQFVTPLAGMMQQQGLSIDTRRLMDLLGEYTQIPELTELVVDTQGGSIQTTEDKAVAASNQPPVKRTESVRINKPGATRQGQDEMMSRLLLTGRGVQDSEAASILRTPE